MIDATKLTELQIYAIENHIELGRRLGMSWADKWNEWYVVVNFDTIHVSTIMDNFNMYEFLLKIGVSEEDIK